MGDRWFLSRPDGLYLSSDYDRLRGDYAEGLELGAVDAQAEVLAPATANVSATPTGSFAA